MADELRPSDDDRERVVRDLTKHCGDGRLTLDELEERIAEAYSASTRAELEHAVRELPKAPLATVKPVGPPVRVKPSAAPVRERSEDERHTARAAALRIHLVVYLSVMALLVMIYTLTNFGGYFWPIWPAMNWGAAVAIHAGVHKARWH